MKNKKIDPEILEDLKKLTAARLRSISSEVSIAIGNTSYSQEDIIKHVEKADEIGLEFMEMQLEFLKDLAKGNFYQYE